jgi:NDP-sugar pyrophosphorylase family protein
MLDFHRQQQAVVTLVLRSDPDIAHYGTLEVDTEGRIRRIREHTLAVDEPRFPYMFTGLQILEPRVFEFMPEVKPFSTTRETYPHMMHAGEPLYGFVHTGPWMVVDDAEGMARATHVILSGQVRLSYLCP